MDVIPLMFAHALSIFYRSFLAVLAPFLTRDLGVTAAQLSDAVGAWFLAFALAQLPVGMALDRFGPRRLVAGFLALGVGGGALVLAAAQGPGMVIAALALLGVGCAPIMTSGMFLFARRYEPARFATLTAIMMGVGGLGNVLSAAPLSWAAELFGWRPVMVGLAGFAVFLAGLCFLFMRDPPSLNLTPRGAGLWRSMGIDGIVELLRMPVFLPILVLAIFNYAVGGGVRGLWAGSYLADVQGLGAVEIGTATLYMAVAMTLCSAGLGPMDRVAGTRKWLIGPLCAACTVCAGALALASPTPETAVILLVALGLFGSTHPMLMAHFRSFVPARLTGRGVTLINVFGMIGVSLGQFVTARLAAGPLAAGAVEAAYDRVFLWYAVTLGAATLVYLLYARDAKPDHRAED